MNRFSVCLPHILEFEGGVANDAADHGGFTMCGITQETFDDWNADQRRPKRSVRSITREEIEAIYRDRYWDACCCDDLPIPLDLAVFDAAVQHGTGRAAKLLQRTVGATIDGEIGPKTLYAVQTLVLQHRTERLVEDYMDLRAAFYAGIIARDPSQKKFERGWAKRMARLEVLLK